MSEFIYNTSSINISAGFIAEKMPEANGAYVKVYLYVLYLASKGEVKDDSEIAKTLGLLESDVVNAYEYWIEKGEMSKSGNTYYIGVKNNEPAPQKPQKDVKNLITEDKTLSDLVLIAQETLGRTLSDTDMQTIYWFYDELGFSPEVICMLLEYCVSKDKRNMKYIEKVAISWHKNGITTMSAAERYMQEERDKNSYFFTLRKLFGIDNRNLSKTEELYLKSWQEDFSMSAEMVALAYEYCIIQTNKLSFPYMNAIIKRWHEKGITTVAGAEEDHENFRSQNGQSFDKELSIYKDSTDYDYENIEKRMQEKYDN